MKLSQLPNHSSSSNSSFFFSSADGSLASSLELHLSFITEAVSVSGDEPEPVPTVLITTGGGLLFSRMVGGWLVLVVAFISTQQSCANACFADLQVEEPSSNSEMNSRASAQWIDFELKIT